MIVISFTSHGVFVDWEFFSFLEVTSRSPEVEPDS